MAGLRRTRRPLVALLALLLILIIGYAVQALRDNGSSGSRSSSTTRATTSHATAARVSSAPASGTVAVASLPTEARRTIALIQAGGPFPYSRDGVVFNNLEHHLPAKASGYYHEYTVVTPGSADRGARRIITGKGGEFYYTANHYDSFVRVDVSQ